MMWTSVSSCLVTLGFAGFTIAGGGAARGVAAKVEIESYPGKMSML